MLGQGILHLMDEAEGRRLYFTELHLDLFRIVNEHIDLGISTGLEARSARQLPRHEAHPAHVKWHRVRGAAVRPPADGVLYGAVGVDHLLGKGARRPKPNLSDAHNS